MLTYTYGCIHCGGNFEIFRSIKDGSPVVCTHCGSGNIARRFLQAPVVLAGAAGRRESGLNSVSHADRMHQAAERTVTKVMKDMGKA